MLIALMYLPSLALLHRDFVWLLAKVIFVVVNIVSLYLIYSYFHLMPLLQSSDEKRLAHGSFIGTLNPKPL